MMTSLASALVFLSATVSTPQTPPPARTPVQVVEAMIEAFNRHDTVAMSALYADDARLTSSDFCAPRYKRDIERTYGDLFQARPDIRDDDQIMIASGDRVAVQFTARDVTPFLIQTERDCLVMKGIPCGRPPSPDPRADPALRHFRRSPADYLLRVPLERWCRLGDSNT